MINSYFHISSIAKNGSLEKRFQKWIKMHKDNKYLAHKYITLNDLTFKVNSCTNTESKLYFTADSRTYSLCSFIFDTETQTLVNDKIYDFYFEEYSDLVKNIFNEIKQFYDSIAIGLYLHDPNIKSLIKDYINLNKGYVSYNTLKFFDIFQLLMVFFDPLPKTKFKNSEVSLLEYNMTVNYVDENINDLEKLLAKLQLLNDMANNYQKYVSLYKIQQI